MLVLCPEGGEGCFAGEPGRGHRLPQRRARERLEPQMATCARSAAAGVRDRKRTSAAESSEGGVLATMAAAHLGLGDCAKALALAGEAIAVSRRRGTRVYEFSALLTRIHALRELRGLEAKMEIEAALAEAEAWLTMSGAKSYEPFLHVERAELARLTGDDTARQREL